MQNRAYSLRNITIMGVGLLGGSIGLAAKKIISNCKITGYGHNPATLAAALKIGAIDGACDDPKTSVQAADLVILCTPVGIFDKLIHEIAPALSAATLVTDVGSTKRSVVELASKRLPHPRQFVGSHPMAGSEKRGVEHARADLFHNHLCLTTPTAQTSPAALESVESFWQTLGMRITRLSPDEHDRLLALVSHLPHAVAAALVIAQSDAAMALAGKGFLDATRIAAGDAALWRDIFLDNRDNLRDGALALRGELDRLITLLDANDAQAVKDWLASAAARRQSIEKRPTA